MKGRKNASARGRRHKRESLCLSLFVCLVTRYLAPPACPSVCVCLRPSVSRCSRLRQIVSFFVKLVPPVFVCIICVSVCFQLCPPVSSCVRLCPVMSVCSFVLEASWTLGILTVADVIAIIVIVCVLLLCFPVLNFLAEVTCCCGCC